jgi:hypothetical protein
MEWDSAVFDAEVLRRNAEKVIGGGVDILVKI